MSGPCQLGSRQVPGCGRRLPGSEALGKPIRVVDLCVLLALGVPPETMWVLLSLGAGTVAFGGAGGEVQERPVQWDLVSRSLFPSVSGLRLV